MSGRQTEEQLVAFAKGFDWSQNIKDPVVQSALQSVYDKFNNRNDDVANAPRIKVVVVGDGAVGKTSLLIRYCTGDFPKDYIPTVFENHTKQVKKNDQLVLMHLWDTAGQEEYDRLRPLSYPSSDVVFIAFSTISPVSLKNIKDKWAPEIQHYLPDTPVILVGTKIDLRAAGTADSHTDYFNPITTEQGKAVAAELGATYAEICAKTGEGLNELFETAIGLTLKARGLSLTTSGKAPLKSSQEDPKGSKTVKKGKKSNSGCSLM